MSSAPRPLVPFRHLIAPLVAALAAACATAPPPEPDVRGAACGNGTVDAGEECDDGNTDPNDSCGATCQGVEICDNFIDDDFDSVIDCAETSCQATAACAPGTAISGAACEASTDCAASANDPFCFNETTYPGFVGGYCAEFCVPGANDCGPDAQCQSINFGLPEFVNVCVDRCISDDECREGYACQNFNVGFGCWPTF